MAKHILYRIYYGKQLMYLGRTEQPISNRLRGHFFAKPMHRVVDLRSVSLIEIAECKTTADMYLYEVYYINRDKPPLNVDDKAQDNLTAELPDLAWVDYTPPLIDKWRKSIAESEAKEEAKRQRRAAWRDAREENRRRLSGEAWHEWCFNNPMPD